MPLYRFQCKCGKSYEDIVKYKEKGECPECGAANSPEIPEGSMLRVMETKDKWRGKKVEKDLDKKLRSRMIRHRNEYELPEMIERWGMTEAKKNKWLQKIKKL